MNYFKNATIAILLILFKTAGFSQVVQDSGKVYDEVASIISIANMPGAGGDDYLDPTSKELSTWENTLDNLFAGNYGISADSASNIGYELIQFSDTSFSPIRTFYILETVDSNYWGTYVYYPDFCRPVVVQSPHPRKDANTGLEGIHVFKETGALFYMVSGTHRCNSSAYTSCSGVTTVCSANSEPFRISDPAHTTSSVFQKTTEVLLNTFSNSHFVQLHGFAKLSTDPYVIISNGTQVTPTPDHISTFRNKLQETDSTLTFKIPHKDTSWTRLRGFFNTQGRLINGSLNACTTNATTTVGRFIHVEQEKTKLREDTTGWNKVAFAVRKTFPSIVTDFTFANNALTVTFTDSTTGSPLGWMWNFGDGNTDTLQNTAHSYGAPGTYLVCLTALDNCDEDSICQSIAVDTLPTDRRDQLELSSRIYPNPSSGVVTIRTKISAPINLLVKDLTGRILFEREFALEATVNLDGLESGVYLFEFNTGDARFYQKLIKY